MPNPNPKPPKQKKARTFSCQPKGNTNKMSKYNFAAAKETLSLLSNANPQRIAFHAAVSDPESRPAVKSPLKKEYR